MSNAFNVTAIILACREAGTHKVETTEYGACAACGEYGDGPTWVKPCEGCNDGTTVERHRGESDVTCDKGLHSYNAGGQRLRDDWRGNMSNYDDEVSDLDGYEAQHGGDW